MKKPIEFQPSSPNLISALTPSHHQPFQDLLLKPEYSGCKYTLPRGASTIRILPAIKGSNIWMASIMALDHANGRHTHPKTTQPYATSVYDTAHAWINAHRPDALYSQINPSGYKLWAQQVAACWILIDGPEPPELRILLASAFAGSRQGATPGLGHKIQDLVRQNHALLDPDSDYQIKVTRTYSAGSKYPDTDLSLHHTSRSLTQCLGDLLAADLKLVCPITDTIRQIDTEQEWQLLGSTIGQDLIDQIRAAQTES